MEPISYATLAPRPGALARVAAPWRGQESLHGRLALVAAALALCALIGRAFDLPLLGSFVPQRPVLAPMTAVILLLAAYGMALLSVDNKLAFRLAAVQGILGALIVCAHSFHLVAAGGIPPRWWSSQLTGVAFSLSAGATALLAKGHPTDGQILASVVLVTALLLGLGHLFPGADLYTALPGTGVAIPTVLAFLCLSVGQLISSRELGVSAAWTRRTAAGRAGLRLLVGGAIVVFLATMVIATAYQGGMFDATTAILLCGWSAIAVLGATLWALALAVDRAELSWAAADRDRQQLRQMVAAAVTHDLRTPLQAANMSAALLQRLVDHPDAVQALARLERSHQRLDRLLRTLLDSLAVGEGEPLKLRASHCRMEEIVLDVISENEAMLGGRVTLDGQAHGCWDRDALFRVIENLLLNAVKYGDRGTAIACRIDAAGAAGIVRLEVANRGRPIPEAEWEAIFLPFARGVSAQDAQPLGWGVGLAYARAVAQGHGGTVKVVGSDEAGTVFELALPVR